MNVKDFQYLTVACLWQVSGHRRLLFPVDEEWDRDTATHNSSLFGPHTWPSASHQQIADPTSSEQRVGEVLKFRSLEIPIYPILLMKGSKMQANSAW